MYFSLALFEMANPLLLAASLYENGAAFAPADPTKQLFVQVNGVPFVSSIKELDVRIDSPLASVKSPVVQINS